MRSCFSTSFRKSSYAARAARQVRSERPLHPPVSEPQLTRTEERQVDPTTRNERSDPPPATTSRTQPEWSASASPRRDVEPAHFDQRTCRTGSSCDGVCCSTRGRSRRFVELRCTICSFSKSAEGAQVVADPLLACARSLHCPCHPPSRSRTGFSTITGGANHYHVPLVDDGGSTPDPPDRHSPQIVDPPHVVRASFHAARRASRRAFVARM